MITLVISSEHFVYGLTQNHFSSKSFMRYHWPIYCVFTKSSIDSELATTSVQKSTLDLAWQFQSRPSLLVTLITGNPSRTANRNVKRWCAKQAILHISSSSSFEVRQCLTKKWKPNVSKCKLTNHDKKSKNCKKKKVSMNCHRKPILYVCLIIFLWYHGVERKISKCMGWNQLWRYLGEYWNKLNFTCLIC